MKDLKVRLPDDLHAALKVKAKKSGRSLNGEMCDRLRVALDCDTIEEFARRLLARQPSEQGR